MSSESSSGTSMKTRSILDSPDTSNQSALEESLAPKFNTDDAITALVSSSHEDEPGAAFDRLKSFDFFNIPMDPFTPPETPSTESQPSSPSLENLCLPQNQNNLKSDDDNPNLLSEFSRRPQYRDVSNIFTEAEYMHIKSSYHIKGFGSWREITKDLAFHTRRTQVRQLFENMENFDTERQRRCLSLYALDERAKSPTSSSSSYGSTASVRSRSSWSSDAGEFPYAYPETLNPKRRAFQDSDDYMRGGTQSPAVKRKETGHSPIHAESPTSPGPPLSPLSPQPPQSPPPLSCICRASPRKACPVHPPKPRHISRLFHIPRRHQKA